LIASEYAILTEVKREETPVQLEEVLLVCLWASCWYMQYIQSATRVQKPA